MSLTLGLLLVLVATVAGQTTPDPFDRSVPVAASTQYGPIEGFVHSADDGTVSNVFLGIPYAKPPVGELRFERPLPPDSWTNTLQTKQFRDGCVPYTYDTISVPFSEDCLYLNVIAPNEPSDDPDGYPILVYIPGGGFWYGDVVLAGFDKATKNFVKRGLVVVTLPYRVGLYGFFTLGTDEDPGNNGLWDQTAGLKWIKNNAHHFGGNPNNVVVWGESAGSAAVDLLTLSPHSRNLFHKAIEGSGAATCEFAGSNPSTRVTKELAAAMGCTSTNLADIKAFLKAQTVEDIMNVSSTQFIPSKTATNYLGWGPRIDKDFFDGKTVEQLHQEAPPKPVIVGLMTLEAAGFTGLRRLTHAQQATFLEANFTDTIRNTYASLIKVGPEYQAIQEDLIKYWVHRGKPANADSSFYILRNSELLSDLMFNQQVFYETDKKTLRGWPVYFYLWDHLSAPVQAMLPAAKGGWHVAEIFYMLDQQNFAPDVLGPDELKVQKYYADIFAQFAYTGNPRTAENHFPRYDLVTRRSLWIDPTLSIKWHWIAERRLFWKLHTSKFNFNILRGLTRAQISGAAPWDI